MYGQKYMFTFPYAGFGVIVHKGLEEISNSFCNYETCLRVIKIIDQFRNNQRKGGN